MNVPQIVLESVSKRFGAGAAAVDSLSLSIEPGETFALFGPSGCGKTTTLRLIAGFERPDEGRIRLGSRIVADDEVDVPPEGRRIGFVFQDYALFPHLTVEGTSPSGSAASAPRKAAHPWCWGFRGSTSSGHFPMSFPADGSSGRGGSGSRARLSRGAAR
jgi:iron(III) transport system ATP-binding protein